MSKTAPATLVCEICKRPKSPLDGMIAELIRPSLLEFIKKRLPDWDGKGFICLDDLGRFRKEYVKDVLEDELGELSALDQEVIESLHQHEILASNIAEQFERKLTFGERLSDQIASFGGSWRFIIIFGCILLTWMAINSFVMLRHPFDPYPFILLNLVLSTLAALQAPVIMMSQNRQSIEDGMQATQDYEINLMAEIEIRDLHDKLDSLRYKQWHELWHIQQRQLELLEHLHKEVSHPDQKTTEAKP